MPRPLSTESWRFRPDIEGLRAVAIVGVILFHAGIRQVSGGFLGVDVFFVLSGFLITGILISEFQSTGTISLPNFWARRIRRLLPAATLVSLATLLLCVLFDSPFAEPSHAKSAIAFASYWSNFRFWRLGADYFDQMISTDPFLHTWSLAIEEQYYLIVAPLCLLLALTVRGKGSDLFRRNLIVWCGVFTTLSFVASLMLTHKMPIFSFYMLPSRAWEFGVGGILAIPASRGLREGRRWDHGLAFVALLFVVAEWFLASDRTPHPGWITLIPVLGTASLIHIGGGGATWVGRLLESAPMRALGRLSYSWYLWHWPLTVYWNKLIPNNPIPLVIGMPLLSLALAQLTYVTIEAPGRRAIWLQGARRGLLAAVVLAFATTAVAATRLWRADQTFRNPEYRFLLLDRDKRSKREDDCQLGYPDVDPLPCAYGDPAADTTIVLFGDSHAGQWFPALEPIIARSGWRLVPLTKSACPAVSVRVWAKPLGREYFECDRWRTRVFGELPALEPRVVIMASWNWYHLLPGDPDAPIPADSSRLELWRQGLRASLARLPQTAAILLLDDSPDPGFDVPTCLYHHTRDSNRCEFGRASALLPELSKVIREVGKEDPRVTYVDPTNRICDGPICSARRADTALYIDTNHMSVRFAQSLSQWLLPLLDRTLASPRHGDGGHTRQPPG